MKRTLIVVAIVGLLMAAGYRWKQNLVRVGHDNAEVEHIVPVMVLIPEGAFEMGHDEGTEFERPRHEVRLSAYRIGKFEVTNAEYRRFCDATGTPYPPDPVWDIGGDTVVTRPDYPVVEITVTDAERYCLWLSRRTGQRYRLPTEAEWEKAARGGLEGKRYPWGDEPDTALARYGLREEEGPVPVGSYPPNGYGLHDVAGNVNEICSDWYDEDYYSRSPRENPQGPSGLANYFSLINPTDRSRLKGRCRVVRGGSYRAPQDWATRGADGRFETPILCAARDYLYQAPYTHFDLGFRLAMDVEEGESGPRASGL